LVKAEKESRELERRSGSPRYGGLDLSQEGYISLPTTPAGLSRLCITYHEAAVALCQAALDRPAPGDRDPTPLEHAEACGCLGFCLGKPGGPGEVTRGVEFTRQAVVLLREVVRGETPSNHPMSGAGIAKRALAVKLTYLASMLPRDAEAEACLREAHLLLENHNDMQIKQAVLGSLVNMSHRFKPAESELFLRQLNQLSVKSGRSPETMCTICLDPLEQPGGDAAAKKDSVIVLRCGHQFHLSCGLNWWISIRDLAKG